MMKSKYESEKIDYGLTHKEKNLDAKIKNLEKLIKYLNKDYTKELKRKNKDDKALKNMETDVSYYSQERNKLLVQLYGGTKC